MMPNLVTNAPCLGINVRDGVIVWPWVELHHVPRIYHTVHRHEGVLCLAPVTALLAEAHCPFAEVFNLTSPGVHQLRRPVRQVEPSSFGSRLRSHLFCRCQVDRVFFIFATSTSFTFTASYRQAPSSTTTRRRRLPRQAQRGKHMMNHRDAHEPPSPTVTLHRDNSTIASTPPLLCPFPPHSTNTPPSLRHLTSTASKTTRCALPPHIHKIKDAKLPPKFVHLVDSSSLSR